MLLGIVGVTAFTFNAVDNTKLDVTLCIAGVAPGKPTINSSTVTVDPSFNGYALKANLKTHVAKYLISQGYDPASLTEDSITIL